jgi:preprotein translocase subunit SecG
MGSKNEYEQKNDFIHIVFNLPFPFEYRIPKSFLALLLHHLIEFMAQDLDCPSCGGANPIVLAVGEFECQYCHTRYKDEKMMQRKHASDQQAADLRAAKINQQTQVISGAFKTAGKMSKRIFLFIAIFMIAIFIFIGYMVNKSMNDSQKMQEEMQEQIQQDVNQHLKDGNVPGY